MRISILALLLFSVPGFSESPNIAKPDLHPYVDPAAGREGFILADRTVNEARVYNFYQRQADYYMDSSEPMPEVLPAYPGLDAGQHGHWGKHNQNGHKDGRWNDIEIGERFTHVIRHDKLQILKGIALHLGENGEASACFDPLTLDLRIIWDGDFLKFDPFRWGSARNAIVAGTPWLLVPKAEKPKNMTYQGYVTQGRRTQFSYTINTRQFQEELDADKHGLYRVITFDVGPKVNRHLLPKDTDLELAILNDTPATLAHNQLVIPANKAGHALVWIGKPEAKAPTNHPKDFHAWFASIEDEPARWTETHTVTGQLGNMPTGPDSAYLVDTIPVPFDNAYNQVMQLTSIGFRGPDEAVAATLAGDLWKITGLSGDLRDVTWQRIASGFNQPFGIHTEGSNTYLLDRGQIYHLPHEGDHPNIREYNNYANDFGAYKNSHTHTHGLHRTADGSFHLTQREQIYRTGPDRVTRQIGDGVRNCMGIGGSKDYFWVGPQEGTWTPATSIIEVNDGEFYGNSRSTDPISIAAPLCFIPRGVDNSVGGMIEVTTKKWGPFEGDHVGLSYGSGSHYIILRDPTGDRPQGAVVPLEGEFLAGVVRGAFHPESGDLYTVGLDGWGDYSTQDGCFHRVRYTGKPVYKPNGFRTYANGLRVDFPIELDPDSLKPENLFAHMWNYEFAKRYGSPEFSVRQPDSLGHDPLAIRSITLLADGKGGGSSIFVELPDLEPVMQLHLRFHLKAADGHAFKTDLFASPMYPGPAFKTDATAAPKPNKLTAIALRSTPRGSQKEQKNESGTPLEGARELIIDAIGGLKYAQTNLTVNAEEPLTLRFKNTDVMPHNLVFVAPGTIREVGMASFAMLNDPKAGEKHYVPDMKEVIAFVPVIDPGKEHKLHFRAPKTPGDYPFICTYPGHWQAMQGVMKVK